MKNILVFIAIMLMASCAKMEFEDFTEPPSVSKEVFFDEVSAHSKENSWEVVYLYFLDKQTKKPKAKYRKALYEPRWYYYELDSVEEYKVLSDVAHPYLMQGNYELGEIGRTFSIYGDSIRIHRCGDYPIEEPKYSLLVVTRKEGQSK